MGLALKKLWSILLIATVLGGLIMMGTGRFEKVYATDVNGIITSNTTWTNASSPYSLTGPVDVAAGVTLTIEPGVVIDLNEYYLQVDGTLQARGNSSGNINFTGGSNISPHYAITFTSSSNDWNEKTGTGCILENAILTSVFISDSSPMIRNDSISAFYVIDIDEGSPQIINNTLHGRISIHRGNPLIQNNTITGIVAEANYASATISGNVIEGAEDATGILLAGNSTVSDNIIYGCQTGISAFFGVSTIERNLIAENLNGIVIGSEEYEYNYLGPPYPSNFNFTIQHNAIVNNSVGISVQYYTPNPQYYVTVNENVTPTIIDNNIQDNYNYSIYLNSTLGLNATNNWWGATDAQAINQTIFDGKRDFNLARVTFKPYLTTPDPEAVAVANKPFTIRKLSPPTEPTNQTGNQPLSQEEILEIVVAILIIVVVALSVVIVGMHRKSRTKKT